MSYASKISIAPRHAPARPAVGVWFHWLTAGLIVTAVAIGFGHDLVEARGLRRVLMDVHRLAGLLVAGLTLARLAIRLSHPAEPIAAPALLRWGARLSHLALYVLLIALPLIGLVQTGAAKSHPTLFSVIPLPSFTGRNEELADTLAEWHEWAAWAMIALVGLHAAAALFHHYVLRDDVMARVVPQLGRAKMSAAEAPLKRAA